MIDAVTAPSTGVATGLNNWLNVTLGRRATYLHRQYEKLNLLKKSTMTINRVITCLLIISKNVSRLYVKDTFQFWQGVFLIWNK